MTGPFSQSPRDRIPWILANHGGKMTRSSVRRHVGIKQADLDIILADLEQEGRIKRTVGKHGELISLKE
jgi:DNA-binding MarR family transcriptional regulator